MSNDSPKVKPLSAGGWNQWELEMSSWLRFKGWWGYISGRVQEPSPPAVGDLPGAARIQWEDAVERAAGTIMLSLSREEQDAVREHQDNAVKMWAALKARHVQVKATSRFHEYSDFFSIRLREGEQLSDLAGHVQEGMRRIQAQRPTPFTLEDLDKELVLMGIISGLSEDPSCRVLVTQLLHSSSLDFSAVYNDLALEDSNRGCNPALYGLQRNSEGVLVSQSRAIEQSSSDAAHAASGTSQKPASFSKVKGASSTTDSSKKQRKCDHCKRTGHEISDCHKKRIEELEKALKQHSANAAGSSSLLPASSFSSGESAGSANAASSRSPTSLHRSDSLWNADTGATSHMTPHQHWFVSYEPFQTPIRLADGKLIYSAGIGAVDFVPVVDGVAQRPIRFSRVLHVPDLRNNLLSVLFLAQSKHFEIRILGESIHFLLQGKLLFTALISDDNAAYLDGYTPKTESSVPLVVAAQRIQVLLDLELWHRRAMHFNPAALKRAMSENLVSGMSLDSLTKLEAVCIPCLAGKMHSNPFPSTGHSTPDILGLIHMDL